MNHQDILKYASIITRGSNRFFDQALSPYGLGCGQPFFLSHISRHEGITMYDLAKIGEFDKATVTRAVQKLAEQGYITIQVDERDHRIRHLYTTDQAAPLLEYLHGLYLQWQDILTQDLTRTEVEAVGTILEKIALNNIKYHQKEM